MLGSDSDIRCLAFHSAQWLMDHDFGIWQDEALVFLAGRKNDGSSRSSEPDAESGNMRAHVVHRIYYCHSGGDRSAWRIYIQKYIFLGVFRLEEEKLGDNDIRDIVVYRARQ